MPSLANGLDAWDTFLNTIFAGYNFNENYGYRTAVSQNFNAGEIFSSYIVLSGQTGFNPFSIDVDIEIGPTMIKVSAFGSERTEAFDADTISQFQNGAYAFVGAFINREGGTGCYEITFEGCEVPLPAAGWLLGAGLFGLLGFRKRFRG